MAGGKLELYVDYMSQPSRACIIFCKANGIAYEEHLVNIAKLQQRSEAYRAVNPLRKVPCLREGGFVLPESAAILRYLASTRDCGPHWYPEQPQQRARVDAALDWTHGNIRAGEAKLVFHRVLLPRRGAAGPADKVLAAAAEATLKQALRELSEVWLASTDFVAGDQVSIADLLMCCELEMLVLLDGAAEGPNMQQLMEPFPRVARWMADVREATAPHYANTSALLYKAAKRFKQDKEKQAEHASKL